MRKTRAKYQYAVRQVRRKEAEIVNRRFASALTENKKRDFWHEAKRIRNSKIRLVELLMTVVMLMVLPTCSLLNTRNLYTFVMMEIRNDINKSLSYTGTKDNFVVNVDDVWNVGVW